MNLEGGPPNFRSKHCNSEPASVFQAQCIFLVRIISNDNKKEQSMGFWCVCGGVFGWLVFGFGFVVVFFFTFFSCFTIIDFIVLARNFTGLQRLCL